MNNMGNFIKSLREEKNWTQEDLANKVCYSREAVSKWERGRCEPDIEVLKKLSTLFDVKIEELIAGKKNPKEESVAVNLYTKNSVIKKKLKIVITILILIVFLIFTFIFASYYVKEYRSVNIYDMYGVGKSYNVSNGLITKTRDRICIKFDLVSNYGTNNMNNKITKIELYYKNNNQDILLNTEYVNDTFIIDKVNNDNLIDFKNFDNYVNNFYIRLYLKSDIIEDIKLRIEDTIINDSVIYR